MAAKPTKIDDVKRPEKVTPAASSRPLVVTNRPILPNDPMVTPADRTEAPKPAEPTVRTARTIQPMAADTLKAEAEKPAEDAKSAEPAVPAVELPSTAPVAVTTDSTPSPTEPKQPEETPVAVITEPSQPGPIPDPRVSADTTSSGAAEQPVLSGTPEEDPGRDPQAEANAEATAADEAKLMREQEIEQLVASGKYYVPINAVQRKRSRLYAILLLLLALALAILLLDAALDANLVSAPLNVPHTHFFSSH